MFRSWGRRTRSEKTLLVILGVLVAVLTSIFCAATGVEKGLGIMVLVLAGLVVFICLLLVVQLVIVAIHELGHLVAGWLVGFKFRAAKIGPFYWWLRNEKVVFEWDRKRFAASGFAYMGWKDERAIRPRFLVYTAGGPVASIATLVGLVLLYRWQLPGGDAQAKDLAHDLWGLLLAAAVAMAALFLLYSAVPMHIRGIANDAMRIWNLLFRNDQEDQALTLKFAAQTENGVRCRDWNIPDLERMVEKSKSPFQRSLCQMYLGEAMIYQDRREEGLAFLEKAYAATEKPSGIYDYFEKVIALDVCFARAYFQGDLGGAEQALARAERIGVKTPYAQKRAEAAVALAKGDGAEAIRLAKQAIVELRSIVATFKPIHEGCVEEMAEVEARGEALMRSQSSPGSLV